MSRKLPQCDHDECPLSHCKQTGSLDAFDGSVLVVDILNTALGRFEAALRDARIEGSAYGRYPDEWEELIDATKALMHHQTLPIVVTPNNCVSDGPADARKPTRSAEGPFAARNG